MSTYTIYALTALGVILVTLFIFKKFIPSEFDFFFTRTNLQNLQNGLTFDPSLTFFRLKKHYDEKVKNEKVFKFSPQKMEKFKNSATNVLVKHIINDAKNSGLGVSAVLIKKLEGSCEVCRKTEYEVLGSVLQGLSHHKDLLTALKEELSVYEKNLEESSIKEDPLKIKAICVNKLIFFFVNLRSVNSETKLLDLFEADHKRLSHIVDLKPQGFIVKEQKSA